MEMTTTARKARRTRIPAGVTKTAPGQWTMAGFTALYDEHFRAYFIYETGREDQGDLGLVRRLTDFARFVNARTAAA